MVPVRAPSPQAQCEAYLHIVSFWVGLVLPLCLLIKTEPAESLKTWEVAWEAHQTEWQSARQPSGPADTSRHLGMVSEACMRQLAGRSWLAPAAATSTQAQRRWRQIYELAWWERCMSWCVGGVGPRTGWVRWVQWHGGGMEEWPGLLAACCCSHALAPPAPAVQVGAAGLLVADQHDAGMI